MLTAKGKYALKALIYLSTLEPGEKAQGLAISKAGNIPKKFLDAILAELRDAGVVYPKKGPGGGYMLARAASDKNRTSCPRLQECEGLRCALHDDEGTRCHLRRA